MKEQMKVYPPLHIAECDICPDDYIYGFRIVTQQKEEYYTGKSKLYHNIVFLLEGELEFSYDNYLNRHFKGGEFFFVPLGAEMYARAITDTISITLTFSDAMNSVCDNCALHRYAKMTADLQHDFHSLAMTSQINMFIDLMQNYLQNKTQCKSLTDLKLKEFFTILPRNYTPRELSNFFYPIISKELTFRAKLIKAADEGFTICGIARELGMSARTFSRKFNQEFGEPARYWLLKQKAQSIKLKLLVPGTTIADIMQEYKFTDMSHFSKFSKEYYGCTPTELIKQIKEGKQRK